MPSITINIPPTPNDANKSILFSVDGCVIDRTYAKATRHELTIYNTAMMNDTPKPVVSFAILTSDHTGTIALNPDSPIFLNTRQ